MNNGPYEMVLAPEGYPGKRYRGKYCYEHHLVWWQAHRELPADGSVIHHKDGNKRRNVLDNLEVLTASEHSLHHSTDHPVAMIEAVCPGCAKTFLREKRCTYRVTALVCSRACRGRVSGRGRPLPADFAQERKECRKWQDGRVEYPPYPVVVKPEFHRKSVSEIKREKKEIHEVKVRAAIKKGRPIYACARCGKPRAASNEYCSAECYSRSREVADWSTLADLIKVHRGNWCAIARVVGVSDAAVRKRAKKEGMYFRKHRRGS